MITLLIVTTTVSIDAVQLPLVMVHASDTELPADIPVTVLVGEDGVVTVAVPDSTLHTPVPKAGALADNVVEPELHRF